MLSYLLSCYAHLLLWTIGWKVPSKASLDNFFSHKRMVAVFSHTSYTDIFILFIYMLLDVKYLKKIYVLVMPQVFKYFGWFLRYFNCIPSSPLEKRNASTVSYIVSQFKDKDEFLFLISPKGTIQRKEWRSGYYHIAEQLNVPIAVAGLDYEEKIVKLFQPVVYITDEESIKKDIISKLEQIIPLYKEREYGNFRTHNNDNISLVNTNRIMFIIAGYMSIFLMYIMC